VDNFGTFIHLLFIVLLLRHVTHKERRKFNEPLMRLGTQASANCAQGLFDTPLIISRKDKSTVRLYVHARAHAFDHHSTQFFIIVGIPSKSHLNSQNAAVARHSGPLMQASILH